MGNLRSKYTDEEWGELEARAIKVDPKEGITDEVRRKMMDDFFTLGEVVTKIEPNSSKLFNDKGEEIPF
jgi:hypothetical protein